MTSRRCFPRIVLFTTVLGGTVATIVACTGPGPTPTLAATATPTATPSASPSPTMAVFVGVPVTVTRTPWPAVTSVPPIDMPPVTPEWDDTWSPDGQWRSRSYVGPTVTITDGANAGLWYYRGLSVTSADGKSDHRIIDQWSNADVIGAPGVNVLTWASDSRGVFAYGSAIGDGCDIFGGGYDLVRIDVPSGDVETLEQYVGSPGLSPDRRWLVYAADGIIVRGLESESVRSVPFSPQQVGDWTWSPSGERAAFSFTSDPCHTMGVGVLDVPSATVGIVVPPSSGDVRVDRWDGDDAIVVRSDAHAYSYSGGTATPEPTMRRFTVPRR